MNGKKYTFALAGNPNCGKTTLFNVLTGAKRAVGNRAGVTVDMENGVCRRADAVITDLPGIYSLDCAGAEEKLARDYLMSGAADAVINVLDATNLERGLNLTMQLMELGIPMVAALNMTDELPSAGLCVNTAKLEKQLGIKVVPISALKDRGVSSLAKTAEELCKKGEKPPKTAFTEDRRRKLIHETVKKCVCVCGKNKISARTERADSLLLHQYLALPLFALVMFAVFQIVFGKFGTALSEASDYLFNGLLTSAVKSALVKIGAGEYLTGFVTEAVIGGIGSVAAFFPQLMLMFLFLTLLEDSGYMARTAFITDRLFTKIGLSGKSFVPFLLGFGCSVPAIMSARTLESKRDRRLTAMLVPFMSCGAKLPIYAVFAAAFFPRHGAAVIFSLYALGMVMAAVSGVIFSRTVLKGEEQPFFLELPPYRVPDLKLTLRRVWEKTKEFLIRAGTILLAASVIIWLLSNTGTNLRPVSGGESIVSAIGRFISPLFKPCGFGTSEAAVSLISGLTAKEAVITSLTVMYGVNSRAALIRALSSAFTPLSAYSFLVFVLLYTPCAAALSALASELNSKKLALFSALWQFCAAWIMSMLIYQIGSLFV